MSLAVGILLREAIRLGSHNRGVHPNLSSDVAHFFIAVRNSPPDFSLVRLKAFQRS
jgi:hypothetical protein